MNKESLKRILHRSKWFQELPKPAIEELINMATIRHLSNGQFLYMRGDEPDGIYGIIDGAIRIGTSSSKGKQALFIVLGKGNWLGEISMFDGQPRISDADAQGDTKILFIPQAKFQAMLDKYPELYKHFIKLTCEHFRNAIAMVEDSTFRTFPERLAKHLISLGDNYGAFCKEAQGVKINLHLSQEGLGQLVGTTRQRINKVLKDWEREGWVKLEYGRVVIVDREALLSLAPDI